MPFELHDGVFPGRVPGTQSFVKTLESVCTIAFAPSQVCDRSLTSVRGPFPAWLRLFAAILPGLAFFLWPVNALFTRGRS